MQSKITLKQTPSLRLEVTLVLLVTLFDSFIPPSPRAPSVPPYLLNAGCVLNQLTVASFHYLLSLSRRSQETP